MNEYRKAAIDAAITAGKFIKSRLGKIKDISFKSQINIVTDVDKEAEDIIVKKLKLNFPDFSILTEEKGLYLKDINPFKWIIDPLDGTTNFAHSFPFFCVSVGLEYKDSIILGVVYEPIRNELFYAQKNKGAYLNKKSIWVSKTNRLLKSLLATGFAYNFRKKDRTKNNINNFINFLMTSQAVRRAGSAALDLCYVACGRFDGFWELDLHPWDTAAASLIVKEAGGKVTKFDGTKYSHYDNNILASNGKIHNQMIKVLNRTESNL